MGAEDYPSNIYENPPSQEDRIAFIKHRIHLTELELRKLNKILEKLENGQTGNLSADV